jgi:chromosome segregation ATPase
MRDNDDLHDIPSMIPARDEVVQHQSKRKQPDIVPAVRYGEVVKVSTWPVRISLMLLTVAFIAAGWLGYQVYAENLRALEQASRRIGDLENRLALVGDSAEETTANVIERIEFNFSEIDKLWAARNATNTSVNELTGRVAVLADASQGHTETTETLAQMINRNTTQVQEGLSAVNQMRGELDQATQSIATINAGLQRVQSIAQDMANIRASLNDGDSTLVGLQDRLMNLEEAVESIDAYRLQVNQALNRLQQNIETVQSSVRSTP